MMFVDTIHDHCASHTEPPLCPRPAPLNHVSQISECIDWLLRAAEVMAFAGPGPELING